MATTYRSQYATKILPELQSQLGRSNAYDVPRLVKVVVNAGIGSIVRSRGKDYSKIEQHLKAITGQKVALRNSRKSIANFKLREGEPVGLTATLRGDRMFDFLNKLVNVALPRVRDFRGISPSAFDKNGNYSLGLRDHYVFPEVSVEDDVPAFGFQVTVVTTAKTPEEGRALLKMLGFPFRER
jgi:large subunit ribosomal protein L5